MVNKDTIARFMWATQLDINRDLESCVIDSHKNAYLNYMPVEHSQGIEKC